MSRRRSQNPTRAISITLPGAMLDEIDDKLTRTQSRSAWIAEACRVALHESQFHEITLVSTNQLMAALHARMGDDETLRALLLDRIRNRS